MNNEISLRTSKGEYFQGDTVYGAVYLHICRPTEANGIKVTFKGIETCIYKYECEGKRTLKNETPHVDFSGVAIYTQPDCFEFGSYMFPFKFNLPKEIPGTFHCSGEVNKASWNVDVCYYLQAYAVGADAIQIIQPVVVYQAQAKDLKESHLGTAQDVSFEVPRFPFGYKKVHITARLIQNYIETGSNMQLRLVVTNQTKLTVTSFSLKLLRYLKLHVRDDSKDQKLPGNMEFGEDALHIAPEDGPYVVHSISGSSNTIMAGNCSAGLDRIQIPLREKSGGETINIPSSVIGKHVKNRYGVEVAMTFSNGHVQTVSLCVPGILAQKNKQWLQWKPPEWAFNANIKLSSSFFSVSEQLLRTEAFSGLPMFQVL